MVAVLSFFTGLYRCCLVAQYRWSQADWLDNPRQSEC